MDAIAHLSILAFKAAESIADNVLFQEDTKNMQ